MKYFLRVLAVSPSTRGFGFAVIEEPNELIDWGVKETKQDKNAQCRTLVGKLIDYYQPDVFVVEEWKAKDTQRRARIRALLEELSKLAAVKKVQTRSISRAAVRKVFSPSEAFTKQQIAITIASHFPELERQLPPNRKPWMPEDYRMSIFDAVSLALSFFRVI